MITVHNAQTEPLAVKVAKDYLPVVAQPGHKVDVLICSREQQNELLGTGVVIPPEDMDICHGATSAWLCEGDYLLDPETGEPILRVFKPECLRC